MRPKRKPSSRPGRHLQHRPISGPQIAKKNPAREVEGESGLNSFKLAVGVKKGEERLLSKVNEWIAANLKNGTLNAIYKKQFGNDLPDVILKQ